MLAQSEMSEFTAAMDKIRAERLEERRRERVAKRRADFLEELKEKREQEGTVASSGVVSPLSDSFSLSTHTHTHTRTHARMDIRTHTHTHARTHAHTHLRCSG